MTIPPSISALFQKKGMRISLGILGIALLALIPQLNLKSYYMGVLCRILLYTILAGSLNVINGYSGQFNIGHAGFFGIGAYTSAILSLQLKMPFWIALPISGLLAMIVGLIVALPTLRLKGIYLAIVTLGASEIIRLIALNWMSLTGGPNGLRGIPAPVLFGLKFSRSQQYYYIFLVLSLVFYFMTRRIIQSRIGRAWISIREDETAARSLGVETMRFKAANFMYGAFWAGIAGGAFSPYFKFISSDMFSLDEGFNILSMVIIGGQGTLAGPIVGAIIVNFLTEFLRPISQYRLVVYAILIIAMMWLRPQGLVGVSKSVLAERRFGRSRRVHRR
ncbi:MAG: branched-chain amino acid ABC transporter permease [Spirochaetaceae bacterium]|nr:branched-chain amino acid ABC transporter permease [Spirochaetaceae bacterium]